MDMRISQQQLQQVGQKIADNIPGGKSIAKWGARLVKELTGDKLPSASKKADTAGQAKIETQDSGPKKGPSMDEILGKISEKYADENGKISYSKEEKQVLQLFAEHLGVELPGESATPPSKAGGDQAADSVSKKPEQPRTETRKGPTPEQRAAQRKKQLPPTPNKAGAGGEGPARTPQAANVVTAGKGTIPTPPEAPVFQAAGKGPKKPEPKKKPADTPANKPLASTLQEARAKLKKADTQDEPAEPKDKKVPIGQRDLKSVLEDAMNGKNLPTGGEDTRQGADPDEWD